MANGSGHLRSPTDLGALIRQTRLDRGLTQEDLADLIGVHRRYVVEIEAGKNTLYAQRLFAILRELGIQVTAERKDQTL